MIKTRYRKDLIAESLLAMTLTGLPMFHTNVPFPSTNNPAPSIAIVTLSLRHIPLRIFREETFVV